MKTFKAPTRQRKFIKAAIKKPGAFTAQAKRAGLTVPKMTAKVLANKKNYSSTTVKRANLAKTLSSLRPKKKQKTTRTTRTY